MIDTFLRYKSLLKIIIGAGILLTVCLLFVSCESNCNHIYSVHKTVEASCTEEGYNEYKCSECGDKYKETISAKGRVAGETPTLEVSQVCTVFGMVLASSVV